MEQMLLKVEISGVLVLEKSEAAIIFGGVVGV
jgi:hypothetical protein